MGLCHRGSSSLCQSHFPVSETTHLHFPGMGHSLHQQTHFFFCSFQHRLNLPEPPNYHCFFLSRPPFLEELFILTVSLPTSLSFTHCGLAPSWHPRDFPHQGHCGLLDRDMIHSFTSPDLPAAFEMVDHFLLLVTFLWLDSPGGVLTGLFLLLWESTLSFSVGSSSCPRR